MVSALRLINAVGQCLLHPREGVSLLKCRALLCMPKVLAHAPGHRACRRCCSGADGSPPPRYGPRLHTTSSRHRAPNARQAGQLEGGHPRGDGPQVTDPPASPFMADMTLRAWKASSPEVGSSRNSTLGFEINSDASSHRGPRSVTAAEREDGRRAWSRPYRCRWTPSSSRHPTRP